MTEAKKIPGLEDLSRQLLDSLNGKAPALREQTIAAAREEFAASGLTGVGLEAVYQAGFDAALALAADYMLVHADKPAQHDPRHVFLAIASTFDAMRTGEYTHFEK